MTTQAATRVDAMLEKFRADVEASSRENGGSQSPKGLQVGGEARGR